MSDNYLTWVEAQNYANEISLQVSAAVGTGASLSDDCVSMMSDLLAWVVAGGASGDERRRKREADDRAARQVAEREVK